MAARPSFEGKDSSAADSLDEVLDGPVDAAIVATDTGRHAHDAVGLLGACDVLVEKPLAANHHDASLVVDAAHRRGRRAHVACCMRFDPGLGWLKERLPTLGALRLADVECGSWLPTWRPGRETASSYAARPGEGGVLLDLIHEIDTCTWLLGAPEAVVARLENRGAVGLPLEVEETALLILRYRALSVTMRLSYALRPATRRMRIWGERGSLEWDFLARVASRFDDDGRMADTFCWGSTEEMYRLQAQAWVGFLRGGSEEGLVDAGIGAIDVAICDAARRSGGRDAEQVTVP